MLKLDKLFGEDISVTQETFAGMAREIVHQCQSSGYLGQKNTLPCMMASYRAMLESREVDTDSLRCTLEEIICLAVGEYASRKGFGHYYAFAVLIDTLIRKNRDYGNSAIKNGGLVGNYVRMSDKVSRIQTISSKPEGEVNYESLADTWLDLAGYAVIGVIILILTERAACIGL